MMQMKVVFSFCEGCPSFSEIYWKGHARLNDGVLNPLLGFVVLPSGG